MSAAVASLGVNEVQQQHQLDATPNAKADVPSSEAPSAVVNKGKDQDQKIPATEKNTTTLSTKRDENVDHDDGHNVAAASELANDAKQKVKDGKQGSRGDEKQSAVKSKEHVVPAKPAADPIVVMAAAAAIEEEEDCEWTTSSPLPAPLHRILLEVSKTGESSTLSWNSIRKDAKTAFLSKKRFLPSSGSHGQVPRPFRMASVLAGQGNSSTNKAVGSGTPPPLKKHRNGLHGSSRRKARFSNHRKRPLHLIRAHGGTGTSTATATITTTATASTTALSSPTSNASAQSHGTFGRLAVTAASGSEQEDASQYDSEGTSTTSNSEVSYDQQHWQMRHRSQHLNLWAMNASALKNACTIHLKDNSEPEYASLREALRAAVGLVLDDWFHHKGGYNLSPAEAKMYKGRSVSARDVFVSRKNRLLKQLETSASNADEHVACSSGGGTPFTIQRIAEVLVSPEKYYTQTHKLCNCLEKLLLVTAPITAFGGTRGGVNSQSQREELELAALADERYRIQSEFRQIRRRRTSFVSGASVSEMMSSNADEIEHQMQTGAVELHGSLDKTTHEKKHVDGDGADAEVAKANSLSPGETERREQLEAAARASLRSKFDHVGIDPHHHNHGAVVNVNVKAIAESRSLTNSPPPPSLTTAPNLSGGVLRSPHATTHGEPLTSPARSRSPILFNDRVSSAASLHNPNMHLLQMHHAAAVAGVSPFDLMTLGSAGASAPSVGSSILGTAGLHGMKEIDTEARSSASSDQDSESDDVSLDDSASDRSDGSDTGLAGTAAVEGAAGSNLSAVARAMALKRQQQSWAAAAAASQQQRAAQRIAEAIPGAADGSPPGAAVEGGLPEDSDVSDSSLSDMAE